MENIISFNFVQMAYKEVIPITSFFYIAKGSSQIRGQLSRYPAPALLRGEGLPVMSSFPFMPL